MNSTELRSKVIKMYHEGQTIILSTTDDERKVNHKIKVKILKFYPNHVMVERNGFKESFTYWDILHMAAEPKPKEIVIPGKHRQAV